MRITARLLASVALPIAAACSYDSTSPGRYGVPALAGQYVLESVDGQPAPALVVARTDPASGLPIQILVTHDTLVIDAAGHYDQRARLVATLDGRTLGILLWSDHGQVTNQGGVLLFVSNYHEGLTFSGALSPDARLGITQDLTGESDAAFVLKALP
jgi:hypothetical protein